MNPVQITPAQIVPSKSALLHKKNQHKNKNVNFTSTTAQVSFASYRKALTEQHNKLETEYRAEEADHKLELYTLGVTDQDMRFSEVFDADIGPHFDAEDVEIEGFDEDLSKDAPKTPANSVTLVNEKPSIRTPKDKPKRPFYMQDKPISGVVFAKPSVKAWERYHQALITLQDEENAEKLAKATTMGKIAAVAVTVLFLASKLLS